MGAMSRPVDDTLTTTMSVGSPSRLHSRIMVSTITSAVLSVVTATPSAWMVVACARGSASIMADTVRLASGTRRR